jgi:hypothetical protein
MSYTDILKLTPTLQATALAKYNLDKVKKKKKSPRDFLEAGFTNVAGTSLIKSTADLF